MTLFQMRLIVHHQHPQSCVRRVRSTGDPASSLKKVQRRTLKNFRCVAPYHSMNMFRAVDEFLAP